MKLETKQLLSWFLSLDNETQVKIVEAIEDRDEQLVIQLLKSHLDDLFEITGLRSMGKLSGDFRESIV